MELFAWFWDLVVHLDVHLADFVARHGIWVYALLFAIVFCETGLVVTPFLPGDSLLFVAGAVAAAGDMNIAALVATLIAHLLLLSTPRPMVFFGWIVALVTVVMVIFPFQTGAVLSQKIATAAVYLVIGVAIGSLVSGAAAAAVRRPPRY
jgi:hypothetical protein